MQSLQFFIDQSKWAFQKPGVGKFNRNVDNENAYSKEYHIFVKF